MLIQASSKLFVKRPCRPLFAKPMIFPSVGIIEQDDRIILPGMVLTMLDNGNVSLASLGDKPYGLSANFYNGSLDELQGQPEIGIWRGGDFEIFNQIDMYPIESDGTWEHIPRVFWNDMGQISGRQHYRGQPHIGRLKAMYNNGNKIQIKVTF